MWKNDPFYLFINYLIELTEKKKKHHKSLISLIFNNIIHGNPHQPVCQTQQSEYHR